MRITIARFSVVETLSAYVPLRLSLFAWGLWFLVPIANACSDEPIGFNSTIRPILSEKCFFCHGPDEKTRGAGLRLDLREDAIEAGAILPGDAANSQLLIRIHEDAPEQRMPPPESKLTELTSEEKQLLRDWISQGAIYEKHWAFEPIGVQDRFDRPIQTRNPRPDPRSARGALHPSEASGFGYYRTPPHPRGAGRLFKRFGPRGLGQLHR